MATCIHCGDDGDLTMDLGDGEIKCGACDETLTEGEIEEQIAGLRRLLRISRAAKVEEATVEV